jgi:hypothetical protein
MTPEEEEVWQEIERKAWQQMKQAHTLEAEAQYKSLQFVADYNGEEMGQMSIRKAYEIGYRAAMHEVERKKNG